MLIATFLALDTKADSPAQAVCCLYAVPFTAMPSGERLWDELGELQRCVPKGDRATMIMALGAMADAFAEALRMGGIQPGGSAVRYNWAGSPRFLVHVQLELASAERVGTAAASHN